MHISFSRLFVTSVLALAAAAAPSRKDPGFVSVEDGIFKLDGKDFHFAGSNAYYFPFNGNQQDIEKGLTAAKKAGLTVFRTWGFNDKNTTYVAGGMPQYGGEGAGATDVVFQYWHNGTSTIDLSGFDKVVNAATKVGIKLIVTLTNNWADYGGMDVYTVNLGGKYHDDFYTVGSIKNAYKRYVKQMVTRYRDSPTIFAWELANEPRCGGDAVRNLPRSDNCTPETLDAWIAEMSAYIKTLDRRHLVTWGGEGEFNRQSDDWAYSGADGGDFDNELAIDTIDFGVFHSYPDWWSKTVEWTDQWIRDHAAAGRRAGKPVVHEEYGWLTPDKRLALTGKVDNRTRVEVMGGWQKTMVAEKMAGDMYWQFGFSNYSYGRNDDDGFTIYLDDAEARPLVYDHAKEMNALNCRLPVHAAE
ncbi:glycoside hydrolase family 5 protein [Thermothielavioides terrestris NRRL 8126]|uniref:Mannan endo-1,4-beta-mannosidase A n=1 Tax=Thermothielavioides terrestris (strain ATCC 38088 / NRRL 8126) TaxID=578455 RepID=G2RGL2_THETT|nr:glycoside hydrolase family 5 protein [Thermothielavioides terrestris NRRL 8126]AEO71901.1 glycoside hydrolase family 5 protein [Thermothielavioides terrestris NRRL 8126]